MADLYVKNGRDASGQPLEVLISGGVITQVGAHLDDTSATEVLDVDDAIISAGWIDDHTHCYEKLTLYYDDPDLDGYTTGVTTVIDAGSTGADNIADFYERTRTKKTNVYAMINISKTGILAQDELGDMARLQFDPLQMAISKYPDFIVGLKARISKSVVVDNGIEPLKVAKDFQQRLRQRLPLMVHVGTNPPDLDEIMSQLTRGDIMTHCFNGKANGILAADDQVKDFVKRGYAAGIVFDIGHGTDSFNFHTAAIAKQNQLTPATLSTDIYHHNREAGPVYNMATCIEKMLYLGYPLTTVLPMITSHPAHNFNLARKGELKSGYDGDLTIFNVTPGHHELTDSNGNTATATTIVQPQYSIIGGHVYQIGGH